ncbi:MAG: rhodanese-like domain-containing protein [Pseudomonadota bacterium]|nr:rhodanese-like domain-containing protein [Pseudomonadota bacterium]
MKRIVSGMICLLLASGDAMAADTEVGITANIPFVTIQYQDKRVRVMRIQDTSHQLVGGFTKTSRKCPPFCFQPMEVAPGVKTVAEVEVINFMRHQYSSGTGLIVDARVPSWYGKGTIPGSVSVPFTVYDKERGDPEKLNEAMQLFNVKAIDGENAVGFWDKLFGSMEVKGNWDFTEAKELLLFCNGAWCGQSPTAIRALLELGYPPRKLHYYRGGMQMWQLGGFTTLVPEDS